MGNIKNRYTGVNEILVLGINIFHGRRRHCVAEQNPRNSHMRIGWLVNATIWKGRCRYTKLSAIANRPIMVRVSDIILHKGTEQLNPLRQ
jgi:hypothetical protein